VSPDLLSRRRLLEGLAATAALLTGGCVSQELPPFRAKVAAAPPLKNCFDTVGHHGFKPYVLGGTCYCNPLPAQMAVWRREGHLGERSDAEVAGLYARVKTLLDHRECNNLCEWGPHVVKGGGCLVPPTPFTENYEEVARGDWRKRAAAPGAAGWRTLVVTGVLLALVAGCGPFRPIEPMSPPVQDTSAITFIDFPLAMWLRVAGHQGTRIEGGLLQTRMRIENFLDVDRWVDVQVIFRDKDGYEVEKTNWEPVLLQRRRVTEHKTNSLNARSTDYRILIRDPKG
jgi:hypothetical protein